MASSRKHAASKSPHIRHNMYPVNYTMSAGEVGLIFGTGTEMEIDTLITGAFGCGVFGQDPREVAILTKRMASIGYQVVKEVGNHASF